MATTIRLLSTYNGYKPGSIITVDDAIAAQLLQGGVNATTDLTGGVVASQNAPFAGKDQRNLPVDRQVLAGQTATMVLPAGSLLAINATNDIVGTREILNPDGTVASSIALQAGNTTAGIFVLDTTIRFNVTFGTVTTKAGVTAGAGADAPPLYTTSATLSNIEDKRGFGKTIEAATGMASVKRIASATAGVFLNNGNVNLAPNGTVGGIGDYIRSVVVEVKTMAAGGKAGIFLTQTNDAIFAQGTTGSAITNTTAQTFTSGPTLTATANQLADRVISFEYVPTGGAKQWFTTRIVSHAAISTTSVALVLEDTPEAGAAPTNWIIHGPQARRIMEPGRAEGIHTVDLRRASVTGGYVAWVGNGIVSADFFGVFSG